MTQLSDFHVTLQANQQIYDSLLTFLNRSPSLKTFYLNLQYEKELNLMSNYIDLKNLYETLNGLKKCRKVNIQTPHGSINYSLPNIDST